MNGVEILSQKVIYETTLSLLPFFIAIIVFAALGFVIIRKVSFDFDVIGGVLGILIGVLLGAIVGIIASGMTIRETNEIDYIEYKVTVDDSVSMNEFLEKYEILEQEGKIYTVKEKKNELSQ